MAMSNDEKARVIARLLKLTELPADDPDRVTLLGIPCFQRKRVESEIQAALNDPFDIRPALREAEALGFITKPRPTMQKIGTQAYDYTKLYVVRINREPLALLALTLVGQTA